MFKVSSKAMQGNFLTLKRLLNGVANLKLQSHGCLQRPVQRRFLETFPWGLWKSYRITPGKFLNTE